MSRTALQIFGFTALALGFAGAFLPLLPTTPFILLSAWCFAKSSPKWHAYLHQHREFGPMIENWKTDRSVSIRHKLMAALMIAISVTGIWFSHRSESLKIGVTAGLVVILMALLLTKTSKRR